MVFSSLIFIFFFLPATLLVYYLCPFKISNLILLISSVLFYFWGEPKYLVIMIFSTLFNYTAGIIIEKYQTQYNGNKAKIVLIISIVINLGVLVIFKYSNFLIENINQLFNGYISPLNFALPIGISFYTFQTMSYTIDVYKKEIKAQKKFVTFAAFVTMFPQLIAGPIIQYKDINSQLESRKITVDNFSYGIYRFVQGLSKKVLLANNIGLIWEQISSSNLSVLSMGEAWLGAIAFSFQIYFDFSGYSDMAIGLGEMFGFHFRENFNYPYCSCSVTEFWRRWHISLGTWFREYVYIPLGGNRKGIYRQLINIFIVWFLTGFWHGASWNFIIWGLYFGILLIFEKLFLFRWFSFFPRWIKHIYTLFFIIISWVIFAVSDTAQLAEYLKAMINFNQITNSSFLYYMESNYLLLTICAIFSLGIIKFNRTFFKNQLSDGFFSIIKIASLVILFVINVSFLVGETYNPFLYFRF
ncbi:MBOAT family O-acyltransferase [Anaerorhabdus sp.]|uniref:MBOAT family O-acyltransferase n=2 Tax=Anaerorhabdus sp. TaxID=1872524 RepID=UPI002FC905B5